MVLHSLFTLVTCFPAHATHPIVLINWIPAIIVCGICVTLLGLIAALSRRQKAATGEMHLLGAIALVDSALLPEGTVLVRGELWRARASDGSSISARTRVRVVGLQGHFLLVDRDF